MRTRRRLTISILATLLAAVGAVSAQDVDTGTADFTTYVALGDSLTAGYWSSGLAETQQQSSYPLLLATQARGTSAGFEQPTITEPGIPAQLQLTNLSPLTIAPKPGIGAPSNLLLPRPYDNLGIPGANVEDVLTRLCDDTGVFFGLVLRNQGCGTRLGGGATAIEQALSLEPTFATVWLGANDALRAATSGLVIEGVTLTPLASFDADYAAILGALHAAGVDVAVATIPDITTIPYVTTVPPAVEIGGTIVPLTGVTHPDPFDPGTTVTRQLGAGDFVLLPAQSAIAMGAGLPGGPPLEDGLILDAVEAQVVRARVDAYNLAITSRAGEIGAAVADVAALFDRVASQGYVLGGIDFTQAFLTGGIFSYDGVHPNPLGYGVVANEFIDAINARFGAYIPYADLSPFVLGGGGGGSQTPTFALTPAASDALRTMLVGADVDDIGVADGERPARVRRSRSTLERGRAGSTAERR